MAFNLKISGNRISITDIPTGAERFTASRGYANFTVDENDVFSFSENFVVKDAFPFGDLIDDRTGSAFNSVSELKDFLSENLGVESKPVTSIGFITVSSKSDFPEPVSGVITLIDNYTYYMTTHIDLTGSRLVGGSNTTILGASSENCSLTSTGLGAGVALITSLYTMPIRHINIKDVDTALDFDGVSTTMALDWTGVNFSNIPNIGVIRDFSNFIYTKGAFLSSQGLVLDGTFLTAAFETSFLQGDGSIGNIISVPSTATINARIRIDKSTIVVLGSTIGVSVDASATIPIEGYIQDDVRYTGGGTYLAGVPYNDNKALFTRCRGIKNSTETAAYSMNGNLTDTIISTTGTPTKVLGTTTDSVLTEKFTHTNNRQTYAGALTRVFKVEATLSCESGNNNQVGCYIAKNGTELNESEVYITTNGSGRFEGATIQALVELQTNDYIEIFVENNTTTNDILVTDLNTIIQ